MEVEEQAQGHRRRLLIMDSQLRELNEAVIYLLEAISELREEMIQFRADRQICGQFNLLTTPRGVEKAKGSNARGSEEEKGIDEKLSDWH